MLAVLVIVITAPIGAVAIYLGGPRLLKHTPRVVSLEVEEPAKDEKTDKETVEGEEKPDSQKLLSTDNTSKV